ncbi:hypothetical protein [Salinisphaera aquimarina]|uniref:Uncharacterized protein n=1 Tax=Salinisphaera aquimarina TaxID=2094031 RepID=A0ABV7EPD3_9GAMM
MSDGADRQSRAIAADVEPLIDRLVAATEGVGLDGAAHDLSPARVEALMNVAVHLYAATVTEQGEAFMPCGDGVSTTEAVSAISALMQSQDLNTFDLALWQSKLRRS